MSKTATEVIAHAKLLANDSSYDDAQAQSLMEEVYQRYWFEFLKDRVRLQSNFVTIPGSGGFLANSVVAAREVLNLMLSGTASGDVVGLLKKDDFHAVVADADPSTSGFSPLRWGAQKSHGSLYHRIAVVPRMTSPVTLDAEILPEYTTPTGGASLEGDDVDAFNVARLTAVEIMFRNGDDTEDITGVFGLLDKSVQAKFQYVLERGSPNEHPQKEQ